MFAIVFVTLYPYLLATGQYLSSRVKYDRSKQFLHIGACTLVPQIMRPSCARDVIVDKVHWKCQ